MLNWKVLFRKLGVYCRTLTNKPLEALLAREKLAYSERVQELMFAKDSKAKKHATTSYEFKQLGMFFTEETCFRLTLRVRAGCFAW